MKARSIVLMRSGFFFLLHFFTFNLTEAQVLNIGAVKNIHRVNGGLEGNAVEAHFSIQVYAPQVIRVRVTKNKSFRDFSYALVSDSIPTCNDFTISEQPDRIILTTALISAEIIKKPSFRVIFKNRNGEVVNEDEEGAAFGTTYIGDKVSVYKKMQSSERFVGMGEVLGNLDKRGMGFALNNTDTYKYGDVRLPMYGSFPFYIGIHHSQVYGLFFNNTYRTYFNFGQSTPDFVSVNMDGGDADYFYFYDSSIAKIIAHYSAITGRMPLPPKWSIGYHQSRCSYYPQSKVLDVARSFRDRKIPIDCIVIDADYLHEYEPFRINTNRFPDLKSLTSKLAAMNLEVTASVNPGIKIDSTYEAHHDGLKQGVFLKYGDGKLFVSDIYPSTNHYVDFTNPKGRAWWIDKMEFLPENGIHGYWNDMNEPAVGGSYLPDNLMFDFDGHKANALEAKNVYGMQMARSSYLSAMKYSPTRRPFILTRSGFSGVQRFAAMWSGDNTASNEGLLSSVLINSQMGLSGMPFFGYDVGGFIGDGTSDLFKRWIEVGIFSPFCRNHKGFFFTANEPWAYGEEAEAISKSYIGFRYRMMPYLYSAFQQASLTGMPVQRSLCMFHPFDEKIYNSDYQYEFMFGDAMLVVPVTSKESIKKIYLPSGDWYDIYTDEMIQGSREWMSEVPIYKLPIFIKSSSILPLQTLVQSTRELPSDTLLLHVFNGKDKNNFDYYEDAGDGFEYQQGAYCSRLMEFDPTQRKFIFNKQNGSYQSGFSKVKLIFHGFGNQLKSMEVNNIPTKINSGVAKILDPLEELSDYYDPNYYKGLRAAEKNHELPFVIFDNAADQITVTWK